LRSIKNFMECNPRVQARMCCADNESAGSNKVNINKSDRKGDPCNCTSKSNSYNSYDKEITSKSIINKKLSDFSES
jgi:hypothetical protein